MLLGIGCIFYKQVWAAVGLSLFAPMFLKWRAASLRERRKRELTLQFKHAMYSLSTSLGAGKSLENGFRDTVEDMKLLYADPSTHMIKELEWINRQVANGKSVEAAFMEFAGRADVEDILHFAEVLTTCKRTGGNVVQVIRRTSGIISEKIEIDQEISVMIAQKRFESKLMALVPIVIIAFLSVSSGDYMAPMYSGVGRVIMTLCLLMFGLCYFISKRIMDMKV